MAMLSRLRMLLRTIFLRSRLDAEMRDEMEAHLSQAAERMVARGMSAEEARRAARREFGNVEYLQEQGRDARGARWLESLFADVRFGLRYFARTPWSTLTMVVLLALGIGLNSALFTFLYSFELMPPPGIERDESLVRIRGIERGRYAVGREFSYPEFHDYRAQGTLFSSVAAWTSADVVLDVGQAEESLHSGAATFVTSNYFQVIGIRPMLGTVLPVASADDAAPQPSAVISHVVWVRHFGSRPDIVGQTMKVNDSAVTIVGVAPKRFAGTRMGGSQVRVWLPLNARPLVQRTNAAVLSNADSAIFSLGARLQPGVTAEQTVPAVQAIAARWARASGRWTTAENISADVVPLLADNYFPPSGEGPSIAGRISTLMIPLIILLIPCTNVSALLVGFAAARRREVAVRLAMGATRRRITRQLITESAVLALAAGALGLFIIWCLLQLFAARVSDLQLVLRWPAFVFTFGIALLTGIGFGLSPALHATRVSLADVLKNAANAVASTGSRLQSGLVVVQIALTQPLLLGLAALVLALLDDIRRMPDPPFADRIVQVSFQSRAGDAAVEANREAMLQTVQERLRALPGVETVVPQSNFDGYSRVTVHPSDRVSGGEDGRMIELRSIPAPPGYFELMQFPVLRGRAFVQTDLNDNRALIIRSDLARRLWGNADPIGRRFVHADGSRDATAFVVIGVVDEQRAGMSGNDAANVFVPDVGRTTSILVRTRLPAEPMIPLIRQVANAEAPQVPITGAGTVAAYNAGERTATNRLVTAAAGGGLIALLLSAIGLYAIVTFAVGQRTREIGIRSALGADRAQVIREFFMRGWRLCLFGLVIGLTLSLAVVRIVTLAQGQDSPDGILRIAAVTALVVVAVASIASWIPARRAGSVDPLSMLRSE